MIKSHANQAATLPRAYHSWNGLRLVLPALEPATKKEIQILRKLWHVGMMSTVTFLYAFILSQKTALILIAAVGGPMVLFDFLRLKWKRLNRASVKLWGPLMRKQEFGSLSGMAYFITALFLIVLCFPKPVAILSILCLAIGDPAACIVGIKYGHDILIKGKSLQGAVACFIACSLTNFVILSLYGLSSEYVLFVSVVVGMAATMAEVLSAKTLDDNFIMPITTALTLYPLLKVFSTF